MGACEVNESIRTASRFCPFDVAMAKKPVAEDQIRISSLLDFVLNLLHATPIANPICVGMNPLVEKTQWVLE